MAKNVSQELFDAIVKAVSSRKRTGYEDVGLWLDWDLNNGVLKGNFVIPVQKTIDPDTSSYIVSAEDFLLYDGD